MTSAVAGGYRRIARGGKKTKSKLDLFRTFDLTLAPVLHQCLTCTYNIMCVYDRPSVDICRSAPEYLAL